MPVQSESFFMKNHDQASSGLEKRLRFLDEFKRIRVEEAVEPEGNRGEEDGDEPRPLSPSARFFLTK